MLRQRPLSSYLLVLIAAFDANHVAFSQAPKSQQPLQPLGDVLHLMIDKDKNNKVTLEEVNNQMASLEMLVSNGEGEEGEEYKQIVAGVKRAAPTIFQLLDSNGDNTLSKKELSYMTKFEKSLMKGGGMKELVRDVFELLDEDSDDKLSAKELLDGSQNEEIISQITVKFHKLFPLRKTSGELEDFVRGTVESIGGNTLDEESVASYIEWIDDDKDGFVQRKEVGKYYNVAGKKFIEISKIIKQMGPMMAMFEGMNSGGGGGGFKMDL